jgi:hypothetical protein
MVKHKKEGKQKRYSTYFIDFYLVAVGFRLFRAKVL